MLRFLPLLLLITLSCKPTTGSPPGDGLPALTAASAMELAVAEGCRPGGGENVLRFVAMVRDSRCPVGTSCIRAGEAVIRISVAGQPRELRIPADQEKTAVRVATPDGTVTIRQLLPYPAAGVRTKAGDYRLELVYSEK